MNVDLVIVVLYLLVTLAVGIFAGCNVRNMKDFSVSSKVFPTSVLVSTIFATWMGGEDLIGTSERVYKFGLSVFILLMTQTLSLFFHGYVIAPKVLRSFSDKVSIGEIMGNLYGKTGQVMSGVSSVFFCLGYLAIQVSALGHICNVLLGIPFSYGVIIGSFIVIIYSAFGGIRSVVFTDVLQFGILIIGIPLMANVALSKIGGWEYLLSSLPDQHLKLFSYKGSSSLFIVYAIIYIFPFFSPMLMQRILMAKSEKQATQSLVISGILYIPFYAVITVIALCAIKLFPGIDPNTAFLNVLNYSLPSIVKGIAISGALAVIMSTADSFLNVSAIAVSRDVVSVLYPSKMRDKFELLLSRLVTVLLGLVSIFAVTMFNSMIDFWVYFSNFWTPVVAAPMLLFMLNLKTDVKTYLISVVVGFVSIVIFRYSISGDYAAISQIIGALVTFFSMFILGKRLGCLSRIYDSDLVSSRG